MRQRTLLNLDRYFEIGPASWLRLSARYEAVLTKLSDGLSRAPSARRKPEKLI